MKECEKKIQKLIKPPVWLLFFFGPIQPVWFSSEFPKPINVGIVWILSSMLNVNQPTSNMSSFSFGWVGGEIGVL